MYGCRICWQDRCKICGPMAGAERANDRGFRRLAMVYDSKIVSILRGRTLVLELYDRRRDMPFMNSRQFRLGRSYSDSVRAAVIADMCAVIDVGRIRYVDRTVINNDGAIDVDVADDVFIYM